MERKYITSTMIRSIGHDPENSTLEIEFNDGAIWEYFDFSESDWYAFEGAASQGKYFHSFIKGKYRENKIA